MLAVPTSLPQSEGGGGREVRLEGKRAVIAQSAVDIGSDERAFMTSRAVAIHGASQGVRNGSFIFPERRGVAPGVDPLA